MGLILPCPELKVPLKDKKLVVIQAAVVVQLTLLTRTSANPHIS